MSSVQIFISKYTINTEIFSRSKWILKGKMYHEHHEQDVVVVEKDYRNSKNCTQHNCS
ncbi:unnamed protein product [Schistosoma margrebowiei]|uniref:Uncharacterized protein n=1 Tax=Schistosoma margrebowiei TaxID=48269 RepID=A0A183N1L8_9TREM|nr:unnamed protein product [Schistosoma margrebowiei]